MEKEISFLKEWAISFLRNKDLIFNRIERIDEEEGKPSFTVTYKDKTQHCYIVSSIPDPLPFEDSPIGLFIFHTEENFKEIVKRWDELSGQPRLTIYSINPFLPAENKWILQPYNHAKIADKDSFKTGMRSMFESVERIQEEDLKRKVYS